MRLLIDDIECCLLEQPKLPRYDAARLRNVEAWREGYDIEVSVAHTPQSDALFGDTGELYRTTEFNASYHTARLEADGVTLFEGMATLLGVRRDEALVARSGRSWRHVRRLATAASSTARRWICRPSSGRGWGTRR